MELKIENSTTIEKLINNTDISESDPKFEKLLTQIQLFKKENESNTVFTNPLITDLIFLQTFYESFNKDEELTYKHWTIFVGYINKFIPEGFPIDIKEIQGYIDDDVVRFGGLNKNGYPSIILKSSNNIAYKYSPESRIKFMNHIVLQIWEKLKELKVNKICIILDRNGYDKSRNFDPRGQTLFQEYRETLTHSMMGFIDEVYVTHVNWFFRGMFAVAKVFMKQEMIDKVRLLGDYSGLTGYFDKSQLLKYQGREINQDFKETTK